MKSRSIPSLATASLLALAVPAFAADDDAEFVKKAASGGMLEVELGKHVAAHAADANVRSFAQRMVTDHGKANQELKAVASAAGLRVPSELDAKHREKLAELSAQLRKSVAGFRLPDSATGGSAVLTESDKKAPVPPLMTATATQARPATPSSPPKKVSGLSA